MSERKVLSERTVVRKKPDFDIRLEKVRSQLDDRPLWVDQSAIEAGRLFEAVRVAQFGDLPIGAVFEDEGEAAIKVDGSAAITLGNTPDRVVYFSQIDVVMGKLCPDTGEFLAQRPGDSDDV